MLLLHTLRVNFFTNTKWFVKFIKNFPLKKPASYMMYILFNK